jgi:hypothetical protein
MGMDEQNQVRQQAEEDARHQRGYGEAFTGLQSADFKRSTEGITWRSRASLAGRVAQLLSEDNNYTFLSWAIYRWPVAFLTHLADYNMAAYDKGTRKAKFTIELDDDNAYFGLYIERGNENVDHEWDWTRLIPALTQSNVLQDCIATSEIEHNIKMIGRASQGQETSHYSNGLEKGSVSLWPESNPENLTVAEQLSSLVACPNNQWIELYFLATVPKAQAIQAGTGMAVIMANTMRALLPVYAAATGNELAISQVD